MMRPTELVISDPHDQPGLVPEIPKGVSPVQIVNFYHYQFYPEKKAYCAKCGAHRHRDGYTVELEDGKLVLTGSTCGAALWGHRWQTVSTTFQGRLDEQGIILDVKNVLQELEDIRARLESWRPIVKLLEEHQRQFRGRMPTFFKAMQDASSTADHLLMVPEDHPTPIPGWHYFVTEKPLQLFQQALDQIDSAIAAGHGQKGQLGVRTVKLREAREGLDAIAHAARGLRLFFFPHEPSDFPRFVWRACSAISGQHRSRYTTEGNELVDIIARTSIGPPTSFPVLDTKPLRRLTALRG